MPTTITAGGASDSLALASSNDGLLTLQTGPSGAKVNALAFAADGTPTFLKSTLVTANANAIGYGTGAGGSVTQITSRTTGVTINTPTGAITLVSAAGSAAYQSFTVTNSSVAATDTVTVNQKSGTDLYIVLVTAVAAGSFRISFATTGGTTSEQPVFNFNVVKGVTS
jgi:hypothetical protein